ncbi:MAG TPA: DsbA family protein [Gemmatimonadaceae bacterium]|nr:DsbA family protein [Gemmatimonadaceae bacterium]
MPLSRRFGALLLTGTILLACNATDGAKREQPGAVAARDTTHAAGAARVDSALLARADSGRIQGSPSAPVWIIEISDFQCPYCRVWHEETYQQVKREYIDTGKARFAYLNLPLPSHRNAWPAAEAAMCAAAQGKFWPMHDALFTTQQRWGSLPDPLPLFDSLATSAGVDGAKLRQCIASRAVRPLIQADADRAVEAKVNSTPTFIIGNARIEGAYPFAEFKRAVDAALARAGR